MKFYHYLPNSFGSVCTILFNFRFEIWYLVWIWAKFIRIVIGIWISLQNFVFSLDPTRIQKV